MTVSEELGAALSARRWWCQPGEPILWALWQGKRSYQVEGLDENGDPQESVGARFADAAGRAAASMGRAASSVGGAVAEVALTAVFGGGDPASNTSAKPKPAPPDVITVGPQPDCLAVRLINSERPEGFVSLPTMWVLTPTRLAVLVCRFIPRQEPTDRDLTPTWEDYRQILTKAVPEKFGDNEPGKALAGEEVTSWFELPWTEVVGCRVVGKAERHVALTLGDGSGFVLNARSPLDAPAMVEAFNGGNQWRNRG